MFDDKYDHFHLNNLLLIQSHVYLNIVMLTFSAMICFATLDGVIWDALIDEC